jgi:hypothetical protein
VSGEQLAQLPRSMLRWLQEGAKDARSRGAQG